MSVPIKRGPVITAVVAVLGMGAVAATLLNNASPYGTFADARSSHGTTMHVAGELQKETLSQDPRKGIIQFQLKDSNGETMQVVYNGQPLSNLSEATKVVAIGGVKDGVFHSDRMLVKCPSKYQGEKGAATGVSMN